MPLDPETLLFVRFRDGADVDALGQLYDATAAELLRVATHLVRDPARAEDLVQQTFVAAIEAAPRFDESRRVRAWLLGILANLARKLHRDEARVAERPVDTGVDPVALAATEEFTAHVDAAISTLPEVYQPVLVLHLKHGMIAAEIAHALRRAPGTVRTQLVRALELLKKALPASITVAGCVLCTPLRGLAAMKQVMMANAAAHLAAGAVVGAGVGVGTAVAVVAGGGTVLMKKYVVAALVLAFVFAAQAIWLNSGNTGDEPRTGDAAVVVRAELPTDEPTSVPATQPADVARHAPAAAPTQGSLRYRFLWESDRTPAVGVFVQFHLWGRQNPFFATLELQPDANGEIALHDIEPGRVGVSVDRAGGPDVEVIAGEQSTATYLIPRGVTVDVAVQDEQQQPIAGARVWLSQHANNTKGHEVATTDATGRATIRDVANGREIGARADGHAPPNLLTIKGKPGERLAVTLTMLAGGATLHGVVRDTKAQPVAGARVWIGYFSYATKPERGETASAPPPFVSSTDANGHFEVRGLPAGDMVLRARAADSGTAPQPLQLRAGETRQCDVTLPDGASLVGFVRDEAGRGLARARISGGDGYADLGYCSTLSAADGAYELRGLTSPCSHEIGASLAPFLGKTDSITLSAGERRAHDFVLKASRAEDQISGQLVDANGAPLVNWVVEIRSRSEDGAWNRWLPTDANGRFVGRGCRDEKCRLRVFEPDGKGAPFPLVAMDVVRGTSDLRVTVPETAVARATISGQVVDTDGKPVVGAHVGVHESGVRTFQRWPTDESGRFCTSPLSPRVYHLEVTGRGMPDVQLGERTLTPQIDLDLGTIVMPRGGRVALKCTGAAAERQWWASVHTGTGEVLGGIEETGSPRQSNLLAAGRYELCGGGDGVAAFVRSIEIVDGKTTILEVALERGVDHSIGLRGPKNGWRSADVVIADSQGRRLYTFEHLPGEHGCGICLGIGTWRVEATTDTGLAGSATILVTDVAAQPATITIDVR
jgi:RNA polymerase sigma factor (sigma-70 family)